jgi:amidase
MQATLERIARLNPQSNAIVSLQDPELLMAQARERDAQLARGESMGWMHGMPKRSRTCPMWRVCAPHWAAH